MRRCATSTWSAVAKRWTKNDGPTCYRGPRWYSLCGRTRSELPQWAEVSREVESSVRPCLGGRQAKDPRTVKGLHAMVFSTPGYRSHEISRYVGPQTRLAERWKGDSQATGMKSGDGRARLGWWFVARRLDCIHMVVLDSVALWHGKVERLQPSCIAVPDSLFDIRHLS